MRWREWTGVARDENLWRDHEEKGLLKAEYIQDYILRLWFEDDPDVTIYELDFRPFLFDDEPGEIYTPLQDKRVFRQAKGDYALSWPNPISGQFDEHTIDLAPECIRFFAERYGKIVKSTARSELTPA